jgi:hypothetical protein
MGTEYNFFIPFEGDSILFYCRASTDGYNPPRGTVKNQELVLTFRLQHNSSGSPEGEANYIRAQFDNTLTIIRNYLSWIEADVRPYNHTLASTAKSQIEYRHAKFLKDSTVVSSLGFPLRERPNTPKTYVVPEIRRKITPTPPVPNNAQTAPDPILSMEHYEHILNVISNMVLVMEQSPRAFAKMEEEDLRTHFLVQLNGNFEGAATGETFNYEGKTDILIRDKGRNIFIAECKNWRGAQKLHEAIDQLLTSGAS